MTKGKKDTQNTNLSQYLRQLLANTDIWLNK